MARIRGEQYVEASLYEGGRMRYYLDSKLSQTLFIGQFEDAERQFTKRFLKAGDTFFDVGSNVGLFSLIAAPRVGPVGHVHAFEPAAKTFERLSENVGLNALDNVTCHRVAASSESATLEMSSYTEGHDAWSTLARPVEGWTHQVEKVTAIMLDDFVKEHGLLGAVHLVKVDVEGWEVHTLQGAYQMLTRQDAPVLLIEFTDENALAAGTTCQELYQTVEQLGYELYLYNPSTHTLTPDPIRDAYPYLNLIAVKDLAAAHQRLRI